ncbi:PAS domain-containing protein [Vandammella animalimorsus]|uniref:Diguanylate cyclase n=1 Tax=Vandammella animalimorsus TaxID=2029117 RepID=A0A2A2ARV2_9BURK|nr:PAS domain-containing protein [Vandammella animalimorsus]PAT40451.1 diguanylate cyclase [Vandammella animalimorsus]
MAFPSMQPADDAQQTHTLHFHDGSSRTVQVSQREIPYPDGRLIISRTDLQGLITHANEAFVELSGYTREELIGQPHCVLRHPDMPRAAFKDLWDTVAAGKKWHGYVKNLRKDGAHYWVYATAVPNVRNGQIVGYTSVRRKPSRKKIAEMSALYQQWLAAEGSAS